VTKLQIGRVKALKCTRSVLWVLNDSNSAFDVRYGYPHNEVEISTSA